MVSKLVTVGKLNDAIQEVLNDYGDHVIAEVKDAIRETAKFVKAEIQRNAPRDTGSYAKDWAIKTGEETKRSLTQIVYSPEHYWLVHLLEWGHATRSGSRVSGRPHVEPAAESGAKALEDKVKQILS